MANEGFTVEENTRGTTAFDLPGACAPIELLLSGGDANGPVTYEACLQITVRDGWSAASGTVVLRAPRTVLGEMSVALGTTFGPVP